MLIIFIANVLLFGCSSASVFYTDNEMQKSLPLSIGREHMNRFRFQILSLLGLKKPIDDVNIGDEFASRYMSMLYKKMSQIEDGEYFNPNFGFFSQSNDDINFGKIQADSRISDTIVSFVSKSIVDKRDDLNTHILQFELSLSDFKKLQLLSVELYFILENNVNQPSLKSSDVVIHGGGESHSFSVELEKFSNDASLMFFSLNITRMFESWLTKPQVNKFLSIEFFNVNGRNKSIDIPKMHCFGVGFFVEDEYEIMKRMKRSFSLEIEENWNDNKDDEEEESDESEASENTTDFVDEADSSSLKPKLFSETTLPSIVAHEEVEIVGGTEQFFASSSSPEFLSRESLAPISSLPKLIGGKSHEDINPSSPKFRGVKGLHHFKSRRCKVQSLYVDFKDLGWDNWVIAPTGYQADYCDGDCTFPLDSSVSPTNHAIVQSLAHLFDDKRAQPAKCAPIAMKSQSLLFFNDKKHVVLRHYHNMRVKQCGCK